MRRILSLNSSQFETNVLFIQPTRWCGLNCRGCYVKAHEGGEDGFHTPWQEQLKLFNLFYNSDKAWANQITISVDDLHKDPDKRDHMLNLIRGIFDALDTDTRAKDDRPEVHMTMHTPRTFYQYLYADVGRKNNSWGKLGMVSFSELPALLAETDGVLKYFKELKVPINYNKLIPTYNDGMDWDKEAQRLAKIGQSVDHIYMVIFKKPVGLKQKDDINQDDTNRMSSDIVYLTNLLRRLPDDVKAKVTQDGCLRDSAQYSTTGFGCASNISRFQVWPDGRVSGCPYAFSGRGKLGSTSEDTLDNLREARKRYEFQEACSLPKIYSSIPGVGQTK